MTQDKTYLGMWSLSTWKDSIFCHSWRDAVNDVAVFYKVCSCYTEAREGGTHTIPVIYLGSEPDLMCSRPVLKLLYTWRWPWTFVLLASISQVLGLQVYICQHLYLWGRGNSGYSSPLLTEKPVVFLRNQVPQSWSAFFTCFKISSHLYYI